VPSVRLMAASFWELAHQDDDVALPADCLADLLAHELAGVDGVRAHVEHRPWGALSGLRFTYTSGSWRR